MIQMLGPDYQEKVVRKWKKMLDAGNPIKDYNVRVATAMVMEATQSEAARSKMISESYNTTGSFANRGAMGAGPGTNLVSNGGGALGTASDFGLNDSRFPSIVIPTLRRIFPELIAHDLVGVQPMTAPVGIAFAMRFQYGLNQRGTGVSTNQGTEMGYNTVYSDHTGASGLVELNESASHYQSGTVHPGIGATTQSNAYWQAFAGTAGLGNGMGATLTNSEWWEVGEDMPMSQFRLEKGMVEAKSRKLASNWSLELAEDMMNMQGLDVDNEMVNVMSYEIKQELDRQLLGEMVKSCIVGGSNYLSDWTPVSADGRNQLERIGTIYTQMLIKAQQIAINTRRGPATFAVASPSVIALLERLGEFVLDNASVQSSTAPVGVARVGQMRNGGIALYRDTLAPSNYILLGYKGQTPYDAGVIYCPYIPLQVNRAISPFNQSPILALRTRYGILSNLFGSALFYQFIRVSGLTNAALANEGGRVFSF